MANGCLDSVVGVGAVCVQTPWDAGTARANGPRTERRQQNSRSSSTPALPENWAVPSTGWWL